MLNPIMTKTKTLIAILLLLTTLCFSASAQSIISIGPMFHLNIGNKVVKTSFGVELAYWNFSQTLPYGIDIGIERQKSKWRIYSEAQTGLIFGGISVGPCLEIRKDSCSKLFLQTSVWANAFIGLDMRFRFGKNERYFSPGLYAKLPFPPNGLKSFNEEYQAKHHTENSHSSHFHFPD